MKLAPAQLAKHLQGGLAPVYIVSGDDPLLCQEAADAIRSAAQTQNGQRLKAKLGEGELQVRVEDNHLTPVTLS